MGLAPVVNAGFRRALSRSSVSSGALSRLRPAVTGPGGLKLSPSPCPCEELSFDPEGLIGLPTACCCCCWGSALCPVLSGIIPGCRLP